jgi:hypothetical protein
VPTPQHVAPRAGQRSDQYAYLSRGGTLWSWPGQNPFRWRDPSGRLAQGILGPNVLFAGLGAYLVGYGFMQDASLNFMARAAARERENQGRPNPGAECKPEAGGGAGRGRLPPSAPVGADDEDPGLDPLRTPVFRGGTDLTAKPGECRIDKSTGLLKSSHGVSLNTDPAKLARFGGASQIRSLPKGLKIIQRGADPSHFEVVPARPMTPSEYQNLLHRIEFH